jgi:prophage maintenance system killer protein
MNAQNQIVIYHDQDSGITIDVKLEGETVWLDQYQLETLFDTDRTSIGRHLRNIYSSNELDKEATSAKIAQVQKEGDREVSRKINVYNLDAILSVGYRVNSKKGTAFRIWANTILKDYLVKGYAVNEKLLKEKTQQLQELKKVIELQEHVISEYHLENDEAQGLIKVIAGYAKALDLLDDYDHQRLHLPEKESAEIVKIEYAEAKKAIEELGKQTKFEGLFGKEKDDSFKGSLENIYQTFDGIDLYKTTEEKAAHLLYFVIKNHSFTDGNKRIAAFLFVWFLERNKLLYKPNGNKVVTDNTLVALTLMIAQSNPNDKDMMIKVVVNLLIAHE